MFRTPKEEKRISKLTNQWYQDWCRNYNNKVAKANKENKKVRY